MLRGDRDLVGMCETIQVAQNQVYIIMENLTVHKAKENNLEDILYLDNFDKVKTLMFARSQPP